MSVVSKSTESSAQSETHWYFNQWWGDVILPYDIRLAVSQFVPVEEALGSTLLPELYEPNEALWGDSTCSCPQVYCFLFS